VPIIVRLGVAQPDLPLVAKLVERLGPGNTKIIIQATDPIDPKKPVLDALMAKKLDFFVASLPHFSKSFGVQQLSNFRFTGVLTVLYVHVPSRQEIPGLGIKDLSHKGVSHGPTGSSTEFDSNMALRAVHLRCGESIRCMNADFNAQPSMLAGEKIAAFFVTDETPTPTVVEAGQLVKLKMMMINDDVVAEMNQIMGAVYYTPGRLELSQYTGDPSDHSKTIPTASIVYVITNAAAKSDPELTRRLLSAISSNYSPSIKQTLAKLLPEVKKVISFDSTAASFYAPYLK
jgi:TRAP-type uncharacterized transport system substrate-binding protein